MKNPAVQSKPSLVARKPILNLLIIFKALRYKQWAKNFFLFAGIIFARKFTDLFLLNRVLLGFLSFCLVSSACYILNDLIDISFDRLHPRKKNRPLASGALSLTAAVTLLVVSGLLGFILAFWLDLPFFFIVIVYALLSVSYTLYFKNFVIIDVMILATGFVLRTFSGTVVINVALSSWLLICTLLLALFLALVKRRQEVYSTDKGSRRKTLELYSINFLDQAITIIISATLTGYFLYTFSSWHGEKLMLTIPFVIYGVFRYLHLTHKKNIGEEPEEVLLSDLPFMINLLLWVVACILIMYFF